MQNADDYRVVFVSCDTDQMAKTIATQLVQEGLAACCTILPNITSIYSWQNRIEESQEVLLIIKCSESTLAGCEQRILQVHSYEVPEIVALRASEMGDAYRNWMGSVLKPS